jgi:mannose-1-phosphate guanylyltransferase
VSTIADLPSFSTPKHAAGSTPPGSRGSHRWGVILAGGDGQRLLPLTRTLTGDDRPKQFCPLTGGKTLLQRTRLRVSRAIPETQTLLMLTRKHENYFASEVRDVEPSSLLIQPYNLGTATAIAYCVTRLRQMDPDGVVAFFPSDHHFANDQAFIGHIDSAFAQARLQPERVILLGIEPEAPEEDYGWIEPGPPLAGESADANFEVVRFWEKPSRALASDLMGRGCLWNSFVMVGAVGAFIGILQRTLPYLLACFESMWVTTVPGLEHRALDSLYRDVPAANFSDEVLSARPAALAVMRAGGLGWTDLGEPERVLSMFLR